MKHALADLGRNLSAGLRLALFMPVTRLAFRIDVGPLLLLFAFSVAIDVATDWIRFAPAPRFSWAGAGGEMFTLGALLLAAIAQALLFRDRTLVLAVPALALAAYPITQVIHIAPYAFPGFESWAGSTLTGAYEIAIAAWSVAVLVRAVAVALGAAQAHRLARALGGGLMLAAPLALAPLLNPGATWWHSTGSLADGRYPNPASEPVLAAQQTLLDDALSALADESAGVTDLYFIGFVGDGHDDAYRQDMLAARRAMDERWDMRERSVSLISSPPTLLDTPMATVTNLRETLKEVAAAINPDEDVVMLYITGPSGRDGSLDVAMPPLELLPLSPAVLRTLLDEAGIVWRIVVVSSCHSAAFVDALQSETTLVLVAAGDDATGGCAVVNGATRLGSTLFGDAMLQADSLQKAFEAAQSGPQAGAPAIGQLFMGSAIESKLKELDRGRTNRGAGRSV
jgi:hypothetical protein